MDQRFFSSSVRRFIKGCNPKSFNGCEEKKNHPAFLGYFHVYKQRPELINVQAMFMAIEGNRLSLLKYMLNKRRRGSLAEQLFLEHSVDIGNLRICKFFVSEGVWSNYIFEAALSYGHLNIIKYLYESGKVTINESSIENVLTSKNKESINYVMSKVQCYNRKRKTFDEYEYIYNTPINSRREFASLLPV